jgi:5,10-methenyltetrahydrofolate synthetase
MSEKVALRRLLRRRVRQRPGPDLCAPIAALPEIASARVIHLPAPLPGEPDLIPLAERLRASGRLVLMPAGSAEAMVARRWGGTLDHSGPWPTAAGPIDDTAPDVIVVPGLAFDPAGRRLGRGGGAYDRYVARHVDALRIGACAEDQVVPAVPVDPWDEPVHLLVTPDRCVRVPPTVDVVGGVCVRAGRLLVGQRAPGGADGGRWEIPGGKRQEGESAEAALTREWSEELAVHAVPGVLLGASLVTRPRWTVRLEAWSVIAHGEPRCQEHARIAWYPLEELDGLDWAAADRPLLPAIRQWMTAKTG